MELIYELKDNEFQIISKELNIEFDEYDNIIIIDFIENEIYPFNKKIYLKFLNNINEIHNLNIKEFIKQKGNFENIKEMFLEYFI